MGTFLDALMTRMSNHYTLTNRDDNAIVTVGASVTFAFATAAMAGAAQLAANLKTPSTIRCTVLP